MKVTKSHTNRLRYEIVSINESLSIAAKGFGRAPSRNEMEELRVMKAKGLGILYMADALDLVFRRNFKKEVNELRENLHALSNLIDQYAYAH